MKQLSRAVACLCLSATLPSLHAQDALERFATGHSVERVEGRGFVLDSGHPKRPGDAVKSTVSVSWIFDPELGEASIEFIEEGSPSVRYFERRGRIFQMDGKGPVDGKGVEIAAQSLGDLTAACVAALHPRSVETALRERREAWTTAGRTDSILFAWNDALWTVGIDRADGRVTGLSRRIAHEQYGDCDERVRFERGDSAEGSTVRAVVLHDDREVARVEYGPASACPPPAMPAADEDREAAHAIATREIVLVEIAPHLYSIDLASLNTRITVAEFVDHCVVIEGAYNSRICDLVARAVEAKLAKPVRYFAFSHLHGQYIGGVRSWIHGGATILVPASTAPLVERIAAAPHTLRPDALSAEPRALKVQTVKDRLRLEDGLNTLDVLLVDSAHTDEYLVFHFPLQKVVLSGDLLFLRDGQGLKGRSKLFAETVEKLGLDYDTVRCTWPLQGFGTKDVVTREELLAALAKSK